MSFRQFPVTDANGDSHVVIEFKPEGGQSGAAASDDAESRYELEDGRVLVRHGREFSTADGSLRLSL